MSNELVNQLAKPAGPPETAKIFGVVVATVVSNVDLLMKGRVQINLPWAGMQPWARVATPMGGMMRGFYFMPMPGDEVLVAFHRGDIRDCYVIAGLWNTVDRPPALAPTDAMTKRKIRTPLGHELAFDEVTQTVTITSSTQQTVTLDPTKVELQAGLGAAKVTVETTGSITLQAAASISIKAPSITLEGASVEVKAAGSATVDGGGLCTIKGGLVTIN